MTTGRAAVLLAASVFCAAPAGASEVATRLDKLVGELTQAYKAKRPKAAKEPLTVFTLNTSEKLAKERVGFATAELLTLRLVRAGDFVVVERTELNRVLGEQKLQLSGAIDPQTAVKVGGLVGARVLLLGSVERIGSQYQINARLVDAQNGEVLAAGFAEIPRGFFETEAGSYLSLVPEEQAIGLYIIAGQGGGSVSNYSPRVYSGTEDAAVTSGGAPQFNSGGIGVRYFPRRWLMLDLAWQPVAARWNIDTSAGTNVARKLNSHVLLAQSITASADWVQPFNRYLRGFAGFGMATYLFRFQDGTQGGIGASDAREFSFKQGGRQPSIEIVRPMLRFGAEFKPQARVGLAFFGSYFPSETKKKLYIFDPNSTLTADLANPILEFKMPSFMTATTLSVYF